MMENEGSNEQRTKYFQTCRIKKKWESARILLETHIIITYFFILYYFSSAMEWVE